MKSPLQTALVVGASGGIGSALVEALRERGVEVVGLSRSQDGLDLADEQTIIAAAQRLRDQERVFDWILNTVGVLTVDGAQPERALSRLQAETMARAFAVNAIGPAMVLNHLARLLPPARRHKHVSATFAARWATMRDNSLRGWMGQSCH